MLFYALIAALAAIGVLAILTYTSPTVRTWVFIKLGVTAKDLTGIIGDLETKIIELEAHAVAERDKAAKAKADAAALIEKANASNATAKRAEIIASNVKDLIAA